jgi:DNA modification methylase
MNGEKADMAHNDPPYGMKKEADGVLNDNLNYDKLLEFNKQWIPHTFDALKDNGSWYCWGIDEPLMDIYAFILKPMIKENKITFRNLITWFKNPSGCGDGQNNPLARSYGVITEKCLFVMCGVQGFNNNSDNYFEKWEPIRTYLEGEAKKVGLNNKKLKEICGVGMYGHWFTKSQWCLIPEEHYLKLQNYYKKEYGAFKKEYDELKKEYDELKKEYYKTRAYFDNTHEKMTEVWQFDRTTGEERESAGGHATPKPIQLCERAIKSSCPDNGLVLDVFLGSGSTMVAAHQLNRKCYGMEIEPKYCQIIIDRMRNLDPNLVIKKNGIEI